MSASHNFYKQDTLTDLKPKIPDGKIPSQIGPYRIESLLNQSKLSLLYLGLHPETKEMLVIKVLSPEYVSQPEMVERFLKEAKIIALSNHPNIVKLYGQGQWEKGLYIAMEFIRGVSLRQFISQQSLSLKRSVDILLQVAYALYHLHSHQVIHGDLKPENILITEDGEIKVIDFGIARMHGEPHKGAKKLGFAGTPNYMSPELKEDASKISFASDIYALGIIAYELITGKLSFGVIHLSLIPKELKKIIEKMLAISVSERYTSILSFITDLSQYLKSGGLEKDRPSSDQVKELIETIQLSASSLSPAIPLTYPPVEIGIAKFKMPGLVNHYYDFFKFQNGSFGALITETQVESIDGALYIALFRATVRTLLHEKPSLYRPEELAASLNRLLLDDPLPQKVGMLYLNLDPLKEKLSFISCGLGGLFRLQAGASVAIKLSSQNPILGNDERAEFYETSDNWDIGDSLTLHSLRPEWEKEALGGLQKNRLLSAQAQAEAILKEAAQAPDFGRARSAKIVLAVHRVG